MKTKIKFLLTLILMMSYFSFSQQFILQPTTISPANFNPSGYVVMEGGKLYMQNGNFAFDPGRGIHVRTGGYLVLVNGTYTCNTVGATWKGVTLDAAEEYTEGNYGLYITPKGGNVTITEADNGIHCLPTTTFGGVSHARNINIASTMSGEVNFVNNKYHDLVFENANGLKRNASRINDLNFLGSSSGFFKANILVRFTHIVNAITGLNMTSPTTGFELDVSRVRVVNSVIGKMQTGVIDKESINANNSVSNTYTQFFECEFKQQNRSFDLVKSNHFHVINSTFDIIEEVVSSVDSKSIGLGQNNFTNITDFLYHGKNDHTIYIYANNVEAEPLFGENLIEFVESYKIDINENNFNGISGQSVSSVISLLESDFAKISGNTFSNFPENHCFIKNTHTTYFCYNEFNSPVQTAIRVEGTLDEQGTVSYGVNNEFNLSPGEFRVECTSPVIFHNTNFIPLLEQNDNNTWSSPSVTHSYNSPDFVCRPLPFLDAKQSSVNETFSLEELDLYPNPFTDFITLSTTETLKDVKVYSLEGKLVRHITDITTELYLGDLQAGAYLIHLVDKHNYTSIHKVLKSQ